MSIHYNKQSQFELFPGAVGHPADSKKTGFFHTTLIVPLENFVVFGLVGMMLLVIAFSLGVERGKYVVRFKEYQLKLKTLSSLAIQSLVVSPRQVVPQAVPRPVTVAPGVMMQQAVGKIQPVMRPMPNVIPREGNFVPPIQPRTVPAATSKPGVSPRPVVASPAVAMPRPLSVKRIQMVKAELSLPGFPPMPTGAQPTAISSRIYANGSLEKRVDNSYTIQVASYANVEDANRAAVDLKKHGMDILIMPKGKYTILCIGKFAARPEAENVSRKFKAQFKDCLIRSL